MPTRQARSKEIAYRKERRQTACDEPVEELIVRAVKPLLLIEHGGLVKLVEDEVKIFLSPADNGGLKSARRL